MDGLSFKIMPLFRKVATEKYMVIVGSYLMTLEGTVKLLVSNKIIRSYPKRLV